MVKVEVSCEPMEDEMIRLIEKHQGNGMSELFLKELEKLKHKMTRSNDFNNICAFGPNQFGPNFLVNDMEDVKWSITSITNRNNNDNNDSNDNNANNDSNGSNGSNGSNAASIKERLEQQRTSLINGFQLATGHGPLCEEPMWGVIYRIKNITFIEKKVFQEIREKEGETEGEIKEGESTVATSTVSDPYGPLSGQVISTMRRACRESFNQSSRRLVEAVFECNMQCTADQLGKLYSVLGQRRCDILEEDMMEGTSIFTIKGRIPVVETVGLADHMRKQTSGGVSSPQLQFDRWQRLDIDPFFQPKTEEEREEFGEISHVGQVKNIAKEYIDQTRERKGLSTNKKIVVDAEKQKFAGGNK